MIHGEGVLHEEKMHLLYGTVLSIAFVGCKGWTTPVEDAIAPEKEAEDKQPVTEVEEVQKETIPVKKEPTDVYDFTQIPSRG